MTQAEKKLIQQIDSKLPWRTEGQMPQAMEFVLCDCGEYGLHAGFAIGMWLVWSSVKRWVYRSEIVEVMKQESIDTKAYETTRLV